MNRLAFALRRSTQLLALVVLLAGLAGCGKKSASAEAARPAAEGTPVVSVPGQPEAAAAAPEGPPPNDAMHQPFAKATRRGDDPPAECNRPPDATVSGKPVGKLYAEVIRLWDGVRFVDAAGKPLAFTATLETDHGPIEIALRPDVAPNHVRNFIALTKAGYYDGLRFDRVRHEEPEDAANGAALDQIEAGCPLGTGEAGYGSIGYWLNPEFDDKAKPRLPHEEGTVGACRGAEADTAACRFYISLSKAPYLDGNYTVFGKVTKGLDVARKIFQQPAVLFEAEPDGSRRPLKPVVINKATIHVHEAAGSEGQR